MCVENKYGGQANALSASSGRFGVRHSYSRGNGGSFSLHFPEDRKQGLIAGHYQSIGRSLPWSLASGSLGTTIPERQNRQPRRGHDHSGAAPAGRLRNVRDVTGPSQSSFHIQAGSTRTGTGSGGLRRVCGQMPVRRGTSSRVYIGRSDSLYETVHNGFVALAIDGRPTVGLGEPPMGGTSQQRHL